MIRSLNYILIKKDKKVFLIDHLKLINAPRVIEKKSVYSAVRTGCLKEAVCASYLKG